MSIWFIDVDNGQMHEHHLLPLLSGIIEWIDPPDAVTKAIEDGKSERSDILCSSIYTHTHITFQQTLIFILVLISEMLDGCRALFSIANVTTPFVFDQLLKSIRLVTDYSYVAVLSSSHIILFFFWISNKFY